MFARPIALLSAAVLLVALVPAYASAATGSENANDLASILLMFVLVFLFLILPYLCYAAFMIWIGARMMSLEDRTFRKAFRLASLQFVIPVPASLIVGFGLGLLGFKLLPALLPQTWFIYALIAAYLGFLITLWVLYVHYTQIVYDMAFGRAVLFNFLLIFMHVSVAWMLGGGEWLVLFMETVIPGAST